MLKKTYSPLEIATWILRKGRSEDRMITPHFLIKACIVMDGLHLAEKGIPLLNERAEVWRFGPILVSLYRALKHYKSNALDNRCITGEATIDESTAEFLENAWLKIRDFRSTRLATLLITPESAWARSVLDHRLCVPEGTKLNDLDQRDHFAALIRNGFPSETTPYAEMRFSFMKRLKAKITSFFTTMPHIRIA